MTKPEAVKEARIAALMQGGLWYVIRKHGKYNIKHADLYRGSEDGTVAEMIRKPLPGYHSIDAMRA